MSEPKPEKLSNKTLMLVANLLNDAVRMGALRAAINGDTLKEPPGIAPVKAALAEILAVLKARGITPDKEKR